MLKKKKLKAKINKTSIKNQSFAQKEKGANRWFPLQFRRQSPHP